jgi:hypothetical protein
MLELAERLSSRDLACDTDFDPMRSRPWFRAMLERNEGLGRSFISVFTKEDKLEPHEYLHVEVHEPMVASYSLV